jgi:hypothetical protein
VSRQDVVSHFISRRVASGVSPLFYLLVRRGRARAEKMFLAFAAGWLAGGWHMQTAELPATAQSQAADVFKSPVVTSGADIMSGARGHCGATLTLKEGDCLADSSGSFGLSMPEVVDWKTAQTACLGKCAGCSRCRYVSVSLADQDCSWYAACTKLHERSSHRSYPFVQCARSRFPTRWHDWCKAHANGAKLARYADKHAVREHVRARAPGLEVAAELAYLTKAHALREMEETLEAPLAAAHTALFFKRTHLPEGVIKATPVANGRVLLKCLLGPCANLTEIKFPSAASAAESLARTCALWLGQRGHGSYGSGMYNAIPAGCVLEAMVGGDVSPSLVAPRDIKVWCFQGRAVIAMVLSGRFLTRGHVAARNTFSLPHWRPLQLTLEGDKMPTNPAVDSEPAPAYLTELVRTAEQLAQGFAHVRVDFLAHKRGYAFGELTFSHHGCFGESFVPPALETFFGELTAGKPTTCHATQVEQELLRIIRHYEVDHQWVCSGDQPCYWEMRSLLF